MQKSVHLETLYPVKDNKKQNLSIRNCGRGTIRALTTKAGFPRYTTYKTTSYFQIFMPMRVKYTILVDLYVQYFLLKLIKILSLCLNFHYFVGNFRGWIEADLKSIPRSSICKL